MGEQYQKQQADQVQQAAVTGNVSELQRLLKLCNSSDKHRMLSTLLLTAVAFDHEKAAIQPRSVADHSDVEAGTRKAAQV